MLSAWTAERCQTSPQVAVNWIIDIKLESKVLHKIHIEINVYFMQDLECIHV